MQEPNSISLDQPHQTTSSKEIIQLSEILGNREQNPSNHLLPPHISLNMKSSSQHEEEKDRVETIIASSNDKLNHSVSSPLPLSVI